MPESGFCVEFLGELMYDTDTLICLIEVIIQHQFLMIFTQIGKCGRERSGCLHGFILLKKTKYGRNV